MPYIERSPAFESLDRVPFRLSHMLSQHPDLEYAALQRLIPTLESRHVYYSLKRMSEGEDFDRAITEDRHQAKIETVLEELHSSNGYVMIRNPEVLGPFKALSGEIVQEVNELVRERGIGTRATAPMLYLFLSSPNSVTPFHFDRLSNFLFQIRGTKRITVFDPFDPEVISPEEYEGHLSRAEGIKVQWKPEVEDRGSPFDLGPGDGVHIPFCSGHFVHNGPELSVSLAIFFSHHQNEQKSNTLLFNKRLRPLLAPFQREPSLLASNPARDRQKAMVARVVNSVRHRLESLADRVGLG